MRTVFARWSAPIALVSLLAACATVESPPDIKPPTITAKNRARYPTERWVLVDSKADNLKLMIGDRPQEVFNNIALGVRGAGFKRWRGDEITPLGEFRIGWVNRQSRFTLFFGLDYPNQDYAERAYREGRIDKVTYDAIRYALVAGATPPQDTPLGGQIGIHGLGPADPGLHQVLDWTSGCIALNDQQIVRLAQWVDVGTRVVIQ